ncbi:hypothetical protein N8Z09_00825 [Methylophilaceae bacterium]|nr:hypothetical protein [Methylophilaceae bacterium]
MKRLLLLLFLIPNLASSEVIYEKLGFTDTQGREVVSLRIEGSIVVNDDREFMNALNDINQHNYRVQFDSVVLNSPGGNLYSAMKIGTAIRGNHLSTLVMPHDSCASACALILQGGVCKMASGDVGIHRTKFEEEAIPLDEVKLKVYKNRRSIEHYLKVAGASPHYIWLFNAIPNWEMKYLASFEKRDFGLFSATPEEMQYRLEIASQKLGQYKSDLLASLTERMFDLYPDATWDTSNYMYAYPSCSEQLFLEDNMTDHVGINIEPASEDIFEIYQWDRGIENDEGTYVTTDKVPYKEGQSYYYNFYYFAKGKEVTYQERVILAAPTTWTSEEDGIDYADNTTPGYEVSEDKTTITVTKTIPNDGFMFGAWTLNKDDPKGPFKIEIIFRDKVIKTFDYVVE